MASGIANLGLGLRLTFSAPGVDTLRADLSRFADEIADFTPFWNGPFLEVWTPWIQQAFATEGESTGGRWAPLSPAYAAWKARRGFAHETILVRTGQLSGSLLRPHQHSLGLWLPTPTSLQVGSKRRGGIYHQVGTRSMPARPPIRPNAALMTNLAKALHKLVAARWSERRSQQRTFTGT